VPPKVPIAVRTGSAKFASARGYAAAVDLLGQIEQALPDRRAALH
jgi:hypothetical protein